MADYPFANPLLALIREYPSASSIIVFAILTVTGYLVSSCCMRLLKKYIGTRDEGLSQAEIKQILEQERQRRLAAQPNKKALSPQEEADLDAKVKLYRAKIAEIIQNNNKKAQ